MPLKDRLHRWAAVLLSGAVLGAVPIVALGAGTATPASATPLPVLSVTPTSLSFPETTLGDFTVLSFTVTNPDPMTTDVISGYVPSGADPNDFGAAPGANCTTDAAGNVHLAPGRVVFHRRRVQPGRAGNTLRHADAGRHVQLRRRRLGLWCRGDRLLPGGQVRARRPRRRCRVLRRRVEVHPQQADRRHGGHAATTAATGWWPPTAASSPTATPASTARPGDIPLNKPIVGMAATPRRQRLLAGRLGRRHLRLRRRRLLRLDRAPSRSTSRSSAWRSTPDGGGYWLVASDGGIFAYGDAGFYGSTGRHRTSTSRSSAWRPRPTAAGYWLVASDGGIFAYGDADVLRLGGRRPPQPADRRHGRHARRRRLLVRRGRRRPLQLRHRPLPTAAASGSGSARSSTWRRTVARRSRRTPISRRCATGS